MSLEIFEKLNWFQLLSSRIRLAYVTFLHKLLKSQLVFPALLLRVNLPTPSCTRSQRLFQVVHQSRSYVCPEAFPVQERELHIGRLLRRLSWGYQTSRFCNFDSSALLQFYIEMMSIRLCFGFWALCYYGVLHLRYSLIL